MSKYLIYFGTEGIEALVNITLANEEQVTKEVLGGNLKDFPNLSNLNRVAETFHFRDRFNTHRQIEGYTIDLDLDEETIVNYINEFPHFRNLIREKGEPFGT